MIITLQEIRQGDGGIDKEFDIIVDTNKIDYLTQYHCGLYINGKYFHLTEHSYNVLKTIMLEGGV